LDRAIRELDGERKLGYRRKRRSWSVMKDAKNGQMVRVITTSAALAESKATRSVNAVK
jgi:hypothetical protein